jgi:hypothetical protein
MEQKPDNLNIDSVLSKDDMNKLVELLGQNSVSLGGGNSKKKNKMTPQAKNFLLNQLTAHQKIEDVQKPFKDMTDKEKKEYREELKLRLHAKQNMFKQNRTNHNLLQKSLDAKVKKEKNKTTEKETTETETTETETTETETTETETTKTDTDGMETTKTDSDEKETTKIDSDEKETETTETLESFIVEEVHS